MKIKKIIVAPDSFKGTLSSIEVCNIVEKGINRIHSDIEIIKMPIADGGEGTVDAVLDVVDGKRIRVNVNNPLFRLITASYAILDDQTAVIEMAAASGLTLIEDQLSPLQATTYGTGELIKDALNRGCRKFIIGVGGSATNDGGIGMAAALGARFLDEGGIQVPLNGQGLEKLHHIDLSKLDGRIKESEFTVACDVDNLLFGEEGAAYIYGPQKGATQEIVEKLDNNLMHYANVILKDLGIDVSQIKGAGAAGGLGAGLIVFTEAKLKSGIDILLEMYDFEKKLETVDLVITGEGKIDSQSLNGKVVVGIGKKAKEKNIPVVAIVGQMSDDIEPIFDEGITSVFSINTKPLDYEISKKFSKENLLITTEMIMRLIKNIDKM